MAPLVLLSAALLGALAGPSCLAGPTEPARPRVDPRPEIELGDPSPRPDPEDPRRLDLYALLRDVALPEASLTPDLLGPLTLARRVPGAHVVRYRGLQGFVVSRLRRVYTSRWRRLLRDQDRAGGLDSFELAARNQAMAEAEADASAGGRWWDRTWRDSLVPELGGAPGAPWVEEVGSRVEVLRLGPLSLGNDLRARLDGSMFGIGIDPTPSRVFRDLAEVDLARDHATYSRQLGDTDDELPDQRLVDQDEQERARELRELERRGPDGPRLEASDLFDLSVEARVPEPDLAWNLQVRPEARFNVQPGRPLRARVGLRAVLELSLGPPRARQRVLDFVGRVRYDLSDREWTATLQVQFVAW